MIKRGSGSNATILSRFLEPGLASLKINSAFYARGVKTKSQQEVFELTEYLGGVVTSRLLDNYGMKSEDYYRNKLEELVACRRLDKTTSCLSPGRSRGRNAAFYVDAEYYMDVDEGILRRGILRCYVLLDIDTTDFRYRGFHSDTGGLMFDHSDGQLLFIVDNDLIPVERNLKNFKAIQEEYPQYKLVIVYLNDARCKYYADNCKYYSYSLNGRIENKSYRFKSNF